MGIVASTVVASNIIRGQKSAWDDAKQKQLDKKMDRFTKFLGSYKDTFEATTQQSVTALADVVNAVGAVMTAGLPVYAGVLTNICTSLDNVTTQIGTAWGSLGGLIPAVQLKVCSMLSRILF